MSAKIISYYDSNYFAVNFQHEKCELSVGIEPPYVKVGIKKDITSQKLSDAMIRCANTSLPENSLRGRFIDGEAGQPQEFVAHTGERYKLPIVIAELLGLAEEERVVWFESKPKMARATLKPVLVARILRPERQKTHVPFGEVPGLGEILFPSPNKNVHGQIPLPTEEKVTPRLVVILGAPGTG